MPNGPCAKQVVTAVLITESSQRFVGRNDCCNPQPVCPRGDLPSGVGYELCHTICRQPYHAETAAIFTAGVKAARGGTIYLEGHTGCCRGCQSIVDELGIKVVVGPAPAVLG